MYPLPTLAAALVERQAIHLSTAQFLSGWQTRAEVDACPEAAAHLAKIAELLGILPRPPELASVAVSRVIDDLVRDIRQRVITDLRHPLARSQLQPYAEQLDALVKTEPAA